MLYFPVDPTGNTPVVLARPNLPFPRSRITQLPCPLLTQLQAHPLCLLAQ